MHLQILQGGMEDYSLDSCLTLLRLYSFSPDRVNVKCLSVMLIKAMLQLPSNDISLMLHMIPERLQASFRHAWGWLVATIALLHLPPPSTCVVQSPAQPHRYHAADRPDRPDNTVLQDEQPIAALVALTQHLEGARFAQFWQAADMCRDTLKSGTLPPPNKKQAKHDICPATVCPLPFEIPSSPHPARVKTLKVAAPHALATRPAGTADQAQCSSGTPERRAQGDSGLVQPHLPQGAQGGAG